jgi:cell wall-associated NlpC family hydrolase
VAVLAAGEIYRYARLAGFSPDQAVTMTAIALAESGGNTGAHNPRGEDSRGLWQINMDAHPRFSGVDLYDPLENAKAAYEVSGHGANITPWTVTHHGTEARYLTYRTEAEVAARLNGDTAVGTWTGTEGYGHVVAAGGVGGGEPVALEPTPSGENAVLQGFLDAATAQAGDRYIFGAQTSLQDADPDAFDCSELVRWAAGRVGVTLPDGSWNLYLSLKAKGLLIPVEQAVDTPGALLFRFSTEPTPGSGRPSGAHVAISLGDGERTIEAMNPSRGVRLGDATGRGFNFAAVIPGISDGTPAPTPQPPAGGPPAEEPALLVSSGVDTDGDGVSDDLEQRLGLDLFKVDTDGDGLSDGYELLVTKTNPKSRDTDGDGLSDSLELALGTDPLSPDSDRDGRVDGARGQFVDQDSDGLSDELERLLTSNPASGDTDSDGFMDAAEYGAGYNLLDRASNPLSDDGSSSADLFT